MERAEKVWRKSEETVENVKTASIMDKRASDQRKDGMEPAE